jgi:GNAT superfamily N-acetyltransferase
MEQIPVEELIIRHLTKRVDPVFFNSRSDELNEFLKKDARRDQKNRVSRTYLCCWNKIIAGFVTLLTDTLELHAVSEIDGIDGYFYQKYPAIKIARLDVDVKFERKGVGRFILLTSIGKAIKISDEIGCRYITVDSKPDSIGFYEKHGFKVVKKYRNSNFPTLIFSHSGSNIIASRHSDNVRRQGADNA